MQSLWIPPDARLADRIFFSEYKDRRMRLRKPFANEYTVEFRGFGMHDEDRRRIIVFRIPANMAKRHNVDFGRVPFLLFADETVEDTDEILAPILHEMMGNAAKEYGIK